MINYKEKLHTVKAFVFDFDGVMTDGSVWTLFNGDTIRAGNIKDGYAIHYAVNQGYIIAVISGATSLSISNRMNALGVKDCYMGCANKIDTLHQFMQRHNLQPEEILCMGDDIPDLPMLAACGIATCPNDAATEVKETVDYISPHPGGKGCVRDVIEQVLRLQGKWFQQNATQW